MRLRYLLAAAAVAILSNTAMAAPIASSSGARDLSGVGVIPVHGSSCHRSYRTHGGAYARHYHDDDCDVVYEDDDEDDYDDCHREVLRHSLSGYGRVWHRHRGSNCRVELYEHDDGPTPGVGGCVRIGPSVICGYGN